MNSLNDHLKKMGIAISQENTPISSNTDLSENGLCRICGREPLCEGLGVIRYDVPIDDPRFGKLFRCPNNPVEMDMERQDRLRKISNLDAYKDKSFYNFMVDTNTLELSESDSLRNALIVSAEFAENPDGWLLLEGTYGCGKTHLAAAIGNVRLQKGDMVLFITVPDLLDHLRSTYGPSSEMGYDETFERIRNSAILILDDLGAENSSSWAQEKLFQLLNHRYSRRLPTVITTNVNLDTLDPRISSRLLDVSLIKRAQITAPDYRSTIRKNHDEFSNFSFYEDMTFESFDTRRNSTAEERTNLENALEIALTYAQEPKGWLVFTGSHSTGKTHLAASIANLNYRLGKDVLFLTVPDLLDYLRVTYSPGTPVRFDQRFHLVRNAPLLVLDDLGNESSSQWAKEKLFQIIDYRYVARLPTVITTAKRIDERDDKDKDGNKVIDPRIISRLIDRRRCMIFGIHAPSYPLRINRK